MAGRSSLPAWRSVWITGASSGIGAAVARRLARKGLTLYLSGRSVDRLNDVAEACREAGADVRVVPFDMADAHTRRSAIDQVLSADPLPDVLINNAGVSQRGRAVETDVAVDRTIMEVDYLASVELTKALLPRFVERGRGWIAAVSSIAGLAPVPLRSSYNAAKAAQLAFFGTLRNELAGTGVQVTVAVPGFVKTAVSLNALSGDGSAQGRMDPNQAAGIEADVAARRIVAAIAAGRRRVYPGMRPKAWIMVVLARIAPGFLDRILQRAEVR